MATMDKETAVVIRFQICIFDILNTAKGDFGYIQIPL